MAVGYANGKLGLEMADGEFTRLPGSGCGSNSIESISGAPILGWQGFPDLKPKALPVSRIFGRLAAFKVEFRGSGHIETDSPHPAFQGRALDDGDRRAVVRFIRR